MAFPRMLDSLHTYIVHESPVDWIFLQLWLSSYALTCLPTGGLSQKSLPQFNGTDLYSLVWNATVCNATMYFFPRSV